jgi:hypothetical protein
MDSKVDVFMTLDSKYYMDMVLRFVEGEKHEEMEGVSDPSAKFLAKSLAALQNNHQIYNCYDEYQTTHCSTSTAPCSPCSGSRI